MEPFDSLAAATPAGVGERLRAAASLGECLDVLDPALRACPEIDGYLISLLDRESQQLLCVRMHLPAEFASVERAYSHFSVPADTRDAAAQAFHGKCVVRVDAGNLGEFSANTRMRFERWQMRQMLALPIGAGGDSESSVGVLVVFSRHAEIAAEHVDTLRRLFGAAASLLALHQEHEELLAQVDAVRSAKRELNSLLRFVAEMNVLTTEREIYPKVQGELLNRFGLDFAAVLMAVDGELRCVDSRCLPPEAPWAQRWTRYCREVAFPLDYSDSASSDVYNNNHPLYFDDIPSLLGLPMGAIDRANLEVLEGLQTIALFPIRKRDEPIGVLWLGSMRRRNALADSQLSLIGHLCDFLGTVIDNARIYTLLSTLRNQVKELDMIASCDHLTGLFNYGYFEIEIAQVLQSRRGQPYPPPVSLVMCDIDHFKRFNDTHGHVAGNAVLQETARRIQQVVREGDFVARYGGEEFVIIFNHCSLQSARMRAEQVRRAMAETPFSIHDREYAITLSLGCAELAAEDDVASFVRRADAALYAAKAGGRNRVEVAMAGEILAAPAP